MLNQKRSGKLARLKYLVTLPVCAGLLCASTLAFSKNYGWVDLAPKKVTNKNLAINKAGMLVNHPTDTVKNPYHAPSSAKTGKRVRFPLPNPMPYHTDKGFPYSEAYYMDHGKIDIVVTLKEKNGYYIDFDKLTAKPHDIKYLKDKFGYVFPEGHYPHLPPPPPPAAPVSAKSVKILPPPPPAKPAIKADTNKKLVEVKLLPPAKKKKLQEVKLLPPPSTGENQAPPPPPAPPVSGEKSLSELPDEVKLDGVVLSRKRPANYDNQQPLMVVNGTIYYVSGKPPKGERLQLSASDSTLVCRYIPAAVQKYGEDARKGSMEFYGHVEVAVVPDKMLTK